MEKVAVKEKRNFRFPLYVTKKIGLPAWKYWLIRIVGILGAFLLAGIVCTVLKPGTFGLFFSELFRGCFDFTDITTIIELLVLTSLLLLIALALTPAFKMKFWNIGAEGQILISCLVSAGIAKFAPSDLPNIVILIMACGGAMVAGIVWSVIPAIFKAFFNTNETLFSLMMNYIATVLGGLAVSVWIKSGSQSFGLLKQGIFSEIMGSTGTLTIVFAILVFILVFFYIKKSIHGYEVTVVGESVNTARYVGINVKKVIIRTMIFTGAIMGLIGFLIVCAINQTFNDSIVGGKGFTGVLIAWLGHFEPGEIALFSFLAAVMEQGTTTAASAISMSSFLFSSICTGIFFFVIIACEFFSSYQIKAHHNKEFMTYYGEQKALRREKYSVQDQEVKTQYRKDFAAFFMTVKNAKKEKIKAESNAFKRFMKKVGYALSYPFAWMKAHRAFNKQNNKHFSFPRLMKNIGYGITYPVFWIASHIRFAKQNKRAMKGENV